MKYTIYYIKIICCCVLYFSFNNITYSQTEVSDSTSFAVAKAYAESKGMCVPIIHVNQSGDSIKTDMRCRINRINLDSVASVISLFKVGIQQDKHIVAVNNRIFEVYSSISVDEFNQLFEYEKELFYFDKIALFLLMNNYQLYRVLITESYFNDNLDSKCELCRHMKIRKAHLLNDRIKQDDGWLTNKELKCPVKVKQILGRKKIQFCTYTENRDGSYKLLIVKHKFVFNRKGKLISHKIHQTDKELHQTLHKH